jgi:hypothetical protein
MVLFWAKLYYENNKIRVKNQTFSEFIAEDVAAFIAAADR